MSKRAAGRSGRRGNGRRFVAWGGAFWAGVLLVAGCSGEDGLGDFPTAGDGDGDNDGQAGDGDGDGDGDGALPPEVELEETFRAPIVAGEYLWSANPETNKVARVNASTLDIEVLDGGHAPTYLAALPPGATMGGALVLNALSHDASVFLIDEEGQVLSHERIGVQRGASAWAVGATGKFAVAWSRSTENLLSTGDGYQDLTVLDFRDDEVVGVALSVGFRPSQVVVNDDETRAYVVSDPGISVLQLGDEVSVLRELFLPETELGLARDVSFTADGSLALVRVEGESEVLLVDTETDERKSVVLPGPVTDLDLSADGSTAVAVVRGSTAGNGNGMGGESGMGGTPAAPGDSHIALLSTDSIFDDPTDFSSISTSEIVGSAVIARDGSQVLLFSNAAPNSRLTILDVEEDTSRVVDVKAPVRAAFLSDDAAYSVVLMNAPAQSSKQGAFALLHVEEERSPLITGTSTPPEFVSIASEASRVLVTTKSSAQARAVTYFGRFPSMQLDPIELPSRPLASGVVPAAGQAFVAQEHAEGRVTFIALETGADKTVTGFELSSKVVQ